MTADEVAATGMVNKVVPRDQLDAETRALAEQIAKMPPFALRQAKRAVNQTLDVQGFYAAIQSVFDVHQTGHGNALSVGGWPVLVNLSRAAHVGYQQIAKFDPRTRIVASAWEQEYTLAECADGDQAKALISLISQALGNGEELLDLRSIDLAQLAVTVDMGQR